MSALVTATGSVSGQYNLVYIPTDMSLFDIMLYVSLPKVADTVDILLLLQNSLT